MLDFGGGPPSPDLRDYDHTIVAFSGGKDSVACVLDLLERGAPPERMELWHQLVDGREGSRLMDWPVTESYCRAFARAFGLPIFFQWKEGGFEREMMRDGTPTAPTIFQEPRAIRSTPPLPPYHRMAGGGSTLVGTRLRFPQVTANLSQRWCSAYLKIDVAAKAITNQARFRGRYTLFVTGERAEESAARSRYAVVEPHRTHCASRTVTHYRPVHAWSASDVWRALERHRVNPHPAYRLGWGRTSCRACIFGSPDQWASLRAVDPEGFARIAALERQFGATIQRRRSVEELADRGTPYPIDPAIARLAMSDRFDEPIILPPGTWTLPAGAYADAAGPT